MSQLHEALTYLGPIDGESLPYDDPPYIRELFAQAEIIGNSIPLPPPPSDSKDANCAAASLFSATTPNSAGRAAETIAPLSLLPTPSGTPDDLQKAWGKPLKLSAKDNPLGVAVFKTAGHDRRGAWFARRSLHRGLGFSHFMRAMLREFPESLKVQGLGPGAGAIRGIAGDRRIESHAVDGLGKCTVWQLSSVFPGPVTPREFVTFLVTSDAALSVGKEARQFLVVSKPTTHEEAPARSGLVKGSYESVEIIREVPLSSLRRDVEVDGAVASSEKQDPELNLVEWLMVTRSDPGGGIPKFMVERGTPGSIVADVAKFLDWACSLGEIPPDEDAEGDEEEEEPLEKQDDGQQEAPGEVETRQQEAPGEVEARQQETPGEVEARQQEAPGEVKARPEDDVPASSGIMTAMSTAVGQAGASVQDYIPYFQRKISNATNRAGAASYYSSTSTSSLSSWASAEQYRTAEDTHSTADSAPPGANRSSSSLPLPSPGLSLTSLPSTPSTKTTTQRDRALSKLSAKRADLDSRIAKQNADLTARAQQLAATDAKAAQRASERHERDRARTAEKHARELRALEAKRAKEVAKWEARREKNELDGARRARDAMVDRAAALEAENAMLVGQVRALQRENTALVARLGKMGGGGEVVRAVRDELVVEKGSVGGGRSRASSRASGVSSWMSRTLGGGGGGGGGGAGQD